MGREDGGPTTRSKTVSAKSYAEVLKTTLPNEKPNNVLPLLSNLSKAKRKQQAQKTRAQLEKLDYKQWKSLQKSIREETEKWKKCLVPRDWGPFQFGPAFKCDKFGLPTKFDNIKQPNWIHNRRKFLSNLNFQERNIVLTGDPFIEFDPATYICIYTAPQDIQNYPNIQANLGHIVHQQAAAAGGGGQIKKKNNLPPQNTTPTTLRSGKTLQPPPEKKKSGWKKMKNSTAYRALQSALNQSQSTSKSSSDSAEKSSKSSPKGGKKFKL